MTFHASLHVFCDTRSDLNMQLLSEGAADGIWLGNLLGASLCVELSIYMTMWDLAEANLFFSHDFLCVICWGAEPDLDFFTSSLV